jgi:hypothetical protein
MHVIDGTWNQLGERRNIEPDNVINGTKKGKCRRTPAWPEASRGKRRGTALEHRPSPAQSRPEPADSE